MDSKPAKERGSSKLDLTSMIDVVFLLLIFFMVGAKFKQTEGIIGAALPKDNQPKPTSPATYLPDDIYIKLINGPKGVVLSLDQSTIPSTEALVKKLEILHRIEPNAGIVISPAIDIPFQNIIETLNACAKAGITDVSFTQPANVLIKTKSAKSL